MSLGGFATGLTSFTSGFGSVMSLANPFMSMFGSLGSTATASMAQANQVMAENMAKKYNAQVSRQNAAIMDMKADVYRQLGEQEKMEVIMEYEALTSQQRAQYGAAGVDTNAYSAQTMQKNTLKQGVYEGQKAKYQRDVQAWELEIEARKEEMSAQFSENSLRNPWLPATTTAINGIGSALGTFSQWQRQTGGLSFSGANSQNSATSTWNNNNWSSAGVMPNSPGYITEGGNIPTGLGTSMSDLVNL